MEPVLAALLRYVHEMLPDGEYTELDANTPLLALGVIDSLAMVGLLAFIEDKLGVRLSDEDILPQNFATLEAISRLVTARLRL